MRSFGVEPSEQPDYSESLGQVYHEFMVGLLRFRPSLVILVLDVGPRPADSPSWVPDWSNAAQRSWLPAEIYLYSPFNDFASSKPPEIRLSQSNKELTVRGTILATTTSRSKHGILAKMIKGPADIHQQLARILLAKVQKTKYGKLSARFPNGCVWLRRGIGLGSIRLHTASSLLDTGWWPGNLRRAEASTAGMNSFNQWYRIMVECGESAQPLINLDEGQHQQSPAERIARSLALEPPKNPEAMACAIDCVNILAGKRGRALPETMSGQGRWMHWGATRSLSVTAYPCR
ncbi:hypothetical protein B0T14DRAFT_224273 [Immersiella caudata]|uniref:Uncharacterized protein n=1 Tax=Immersiella caudata TaxID=314043 RepID=A0AA40C027_9PEZI|nr:hypothetical protein B0T14DRAFT_224273 [Immersiella caudata]